MGKGEGKKRGDKGRGGGVKRSRTAMGKKSGGGMGRCGGCGGLGWGVEVGGGLRGGLSYGEEEPPTN